MPNQVSVTFETILNKPTYIGLLSLLLLLTASTHAQWAEFPTGDLDSRTLRTQTKAEGLYQRGDFKRAHFIYTKALAPAGDKYAQYMAGYMYMMGQGVPEDPVRASAWYRLSAERGSPEFVAVRDELLGAFSDEQKSLSDSLYIDLRREFSDIVIVMRLLEKDLGDLKENSTGSRLASRSTSLTIMDPATGRQMSADYYRNRVLRIAQLRLNFIAAKLGIESIDAELSANEITALWDQVNEHVAAVDDAREIIVTP